MALFECEGTYLCFGTVLNLIREAALIRAVTQTQPVNFFHALALLIISKCVFFAVEVQNVILCLLMFIFVQCPVESERLALDARLIAETVDVAVAEAAGGT